MPEATTNTPPPLPAHVIAELKKNGTYMNGNHAAAQTMPDDILLLAQQAAANSNDVHVPSAPPPITYEMLKAQVEAFGHNGKIKQAVDVEILFNTAVRCDLSAAQINTLKTSIEEKNLPGVGKRVINKIWAECEAAAPQDWVPAEYGEDALAASFSRAHKDDLRYVNKFGKWYHWRGNHWHEDDTLMAYDLVRAANRACAIKCSDPRVAASISSAKTVNAVVSLARADRIHATTVEAFDSDPWILNTPDCVVDLKTGFTRPNAQTDLCTKLTAVSPSACGDMPLWQDFLDTSTGGDKDYQRYQQKVCGYALTGLTYEHAMFFLHGLGGNGKSVFIRTISGIMKDYHKTAPIETFTASMGDRHPTELAMLVGARLVTANETEEGRRWDEAKVKNLTGGDIITARFMAKDFFDYVPQFKLMIVGNHKPGLKTVDAAIARRMNLLPYTVEIAPEKKDIELPDKLKAEWPAILRWMIEGCLLWQQEGIAKPKCVEDATAEYLASEDVIATWIDENCHRGSTVSCLSSILFKNYTQWCADNGEYAKSSKKFKTLLEERGIVCERKTAGVTYIGLTTK